jgi:hypothetical protein
MTSEKIEEGDYHTNRKFGDCFLLMSGICSCTRDFIEAINYCDADGILIAISCRKVEKHKQTKSAIYFLIMESDPSSLK